MTQLSDNISTFIVHMLMECHMLMDPSCYVAYIDLKPNQLNDADCEKPFYFFHKTLFIYVFL